MIMRLWLLSLFLAVPALAQATDQGRTILVLDASGSMWGQIDGTNKIVIARDAIAQMVDNWDAETEIGLVAYGHNRDGDCTDIETLIRPNALDAAGFLDQVNQVNPKGKTPLTDAVIHAAELLGFENQKATVILLTDGLETCDRDPCAAASALEDRGIDFTTHVIAFDVAAADAPALSCMAENTGGLYLQADNIEGLDQAFKTVAATTIQRASEMNFDLGPATLIVPEFVIVGRPFTAEWTGPKNAGDWLHVRTQERGDSLAGTPIGPAHVGPVVELLAPLDIGTYELFYEVSDQHPPLARATINVVTVAPSVIIDSDVPAGAAFAVNWTGPGASGDRLHLVDPITGEVLSTGTARAVDAGITMLTAPTDIGSFDVRLVAGNAKVLASATFTTTAVIGSIALPDVRFTVGTRNIDVAWTGPGNVGDRLKVRAVGTDKYLSQRPVFGTARSPIKVRLPREVGSFILELIGTDGAVWAAQEFEVIGN